MTPHGLAPRQLWIASGFVLWLFFILFLSARASLAQETSGNDPQPVAAASAGQDAGDGAGAADTPATFLASITVTATRNAGTVAETPGTVSVIDRREIEEGLYQNARDLLKYEPAVELSNDPTRLGLNGFTIRGIGGNRVLTTVDGVPAAEQFDFGPLAVHQSFLDLDVVQSVEILRSAGSSLYGSDALGGVVSVVTRDPADFLAQGRPYVGLRSSWDGRADELSESLALAFGGSVWQGSVVVSRRDGNEVRNRGDVKTADDTRTAANPQDRGATQVLAKAVHQGVGGSLLKLTVETFDSDVDTDVLSSQGLAVGLPGLPPGTTYVVDTSNFDAADTAERRRISLEQALDPGVSLADHLLWRIYGQRSESEQETFELRQFTIGGGVLGPLTTSVSERRGFLSFEQSSLGGELQATKELTLSTQKDSARSGLLTYGVSVIQDRFDQRRDRHEVDLFSGAEIPSSLTFPTKYFPRSTVRQVGAYVQGELVLAGGRLKLVPGVRFDRFDLNADQDDPVFISGNPGTELPVDSRDQAFSPRLGVVWSLGSGAGAAHSVFAQYARGFRAPPFSDVNNGFTNAALGYETLPNANLQPETSDNFELGWRASGRRGAISLVVFDNRYQDFISTVALGFDPTSGLLQFQPLNLGRVDISGVELSAEGRWDAWRLRGAFAYLEGEDVTADQPLNTISPTRLTLGLSYRQPGGRWGGELSATLSAAKDEEDLDRTVVDQFAAPSYQAVDLTGYYTVNERLALQLGVLNLLDQRYWQWGDVQGVSEGSPVLDRYSSPGRAVAASVRWHW